MIADSLTPLTHKSLMPDFAHGCTPQSLPQLEPQQAPHPNHWHVYLLRCNDGSLYTGISLDPERRCMEHNQQISHASRYVWARRPALLVWQRTVADQSLALQLEYRLKRLTKVRKERLLQEENLWLELQVAIKTAPLRRRK